MNPEIKAKWVVALRSGDYPQTTNVLHRTKAVEGFPAGYCCLGVLCDLAVKDGIINPPVPDEFSGYARYDGSVAYLPFSVGRWSDLKGSPAVEPTADWIKINHLTQLNDSGSSFEEIADWIEANL